MTIGSITFGPTKTFAETPAWQRAQIAHQAHFSLVDTSIRACNCMGPQGGEKLCPCMLAAEMKKADQMLRDGVTINGRKYRLVPEGN